MYDDESGFPLFDDEYGADTIEDDTLVSEDAKDLYESLDEHDDSVDYEKDDEDEF